MIRLKKIFGPCRLPGGVLLFLLFLLLFSFPFSLSAPADFRVAVASDIHFIAPSLTDGGEYYQRVLENGDSKFMPYSEEITSAFIEEIILDRPDALLLTGDLTFNGAVISHEALRDRLWAVEESGIPVLVLTGNHDVYNTNAARFHGNSFTRVPYAETESFASIYQNFGLGEAISSDTDSLSYVYPLGPSVRIILFDFNTVHDTCGISKKTLAWAEQELRVAREAGVKVFAAGHQNLFPHSIFRGGYMIRGADALSSLLRLYGVPLFLSGHLHIQHIIEEDGLTEITTSALCSYPCQYGILEEKDGTLRYYTKRLDMAAWAERNGREESVFQDFAEAAAAYMTEHFRVPSPVTAEFNRWEEMEDYLARLNLAYFSGDLRGMDPEGAEAWLQENDLTSLYVASVVDDIGKDFTVWQSNW